MSDTNLTRVTEREAQWPHRKVQSLNPSTSEDPGFNRSNLQWNVLNEVISIEETVVTTSSGKAPAFEASMLSTWRKVVLKEGIVSQENIKFMTPALHQQLLETRERVSEWSKSLLLGARVRANPFETIRHAIFMNRAALKIANVDAILGFELTSPKTSNGMSAVPGHELFYFADVCAGPGGFSEYVLWRKKWEAKGFGFTLKNTDCDFNLDQFLAGTPESFEVNYGTKGDGNVLDPENVTHFVEYVMENTNGKGVHLMMADGGIEVEDKSQQEEICKGLYLAQFLVALGIVREGGNFVCKLFDTVSPFSVGLIYLIYFSFNEIAIHKPHSSRPANPERYIICKGRKSRDSTQGIYEYFAKCHDMLWNFEKNKTKGVAALDIVELVPVDILMKTNSAFFKYIKEANDSLATHQILALQKMEAYCEDQTLYEIRQKDCRQACLAYWDVPSELTRRDIIQSVDASSDEFTTLRHKYTLSLFPRMAEELTKKILKEVFQSPFDWRLVILGTGPIKVSRAFFYGMGGTVVQRFQANYWNPITFNLTLPKDTLLYAEFVTEVTTDLKQNVTAFHIVDGLFLGGKDIRNLHYTQRYENCSRFAKALYKPGTPDAIPIRMKSVIRMEHIASIFERIETSALPEASSQTKFKTRRLFPVEATSKGSKYFHPEGILFLKITKEPWEMKFKRSVGRKYWFNKETNASTFNCPADAIADFKYTTEKAIIWNWNERTQVDVINTLIPNPALDSSDEVHVKELIDHVDRFLGQGHAVTIAPPQKPIFPEESESDSD